MGDEVSHALFVSGSAAPPWCAEVCAARALVAGGSGGVCTDASVSRSQTVTIPRARIKRVMKADEEIKQIKPDAVLLVGKATELFVELLVESAYRHSQSEKRKGLMYKVRGPRPAPTPALAPQTARPAEPAMSPCRTSRRR